MSLQRQIHQPLEGENTEDGECEDKDATGEQHGALAPGTTSPPLRTSASGLEFGVGARFLWLHESPALRAGRRTANGGSLFGKGLARCYWPEWLLSVTP